MKNDSLRHQAAFCRRRAAFTLTELLVVLGIIGLLAALLLPVLFQSREKARQSDCLSNYHQIGQAIQMYAADVDGDTPPDGGSFGGLIQDCAPYVKADASGIFTCPDDDDKDEEKRAGSYRMPTLYQGKSLNGGWPDGYSTLSPLPLAQPSATTMVYEAEQDAKQPIVPTFRHQNGTQVLYFDGHAKWIPRTR